MNRKLAFALAAAALVSSNAFAGPGDLRTSVPLSSMGVETQPFVSTRSRAEVKAELAQADRYQSPWTAQEASPVATASALTRAEVRAEVMADRTHMAGNPYNGQ